MIIAERFEALAKINRSQGNLYGDFKKLGRVLSSIFPEGLTINGEDDWNRLALFIFAVNKQVRYSVNFHRGGHGDSLDDVSVYSMMLRNMDEPKKRERKKRRKDKLPRVVI